MRNVENSLESFLGTTSPEEFASVEEVEHYFTQEHLEWMFGQDVFFIDMEEVEELKKWIIEKYFDNFNEIIDLIKKAGEKWGTNGNITLLREAFYICNPSRPNGWGCDAVRLTDDRTLEFGRVSWDFAEWLDDADDYDWSIEQESFKSYSSYDLTDTGERYNAHQELKRWV